MTDTCDVYDFLMGLDLEQLETIKLKLEKTIQQQHEQRKRPKHPPAFHDLDALADNTGLDLSGLIKDIKRRS